MSATIIAPGRLTKDAEIRKAGQSECVAFSVAVNCYENREKVTRYYDCSWFGGKRATSMLPMLLKGAAVTVTGGHRTREHNGKTYQSIDVWNVELQSGKQQGQQSAASQPSSGGGYSDEDYGAAPSGDDDFPFD